MTRTTLHVLVLLLAAAAVPAFASWTGVDVWVALPLAPAIWFACTSGGRALHGIVVRKRLERDRRLRRRTRATRAMEVSARLRRIATGEAGFTRGGIHLPSLERAVLFPGSPGEERAVMEDLSLESTDSEAALVEGLVLTVDELTYALSAPLHPLHLDAESLLPMLGVRIPRVFGCLRATQTWARVRGELRTPFPRETLAIRLLQAGMPTAALRALRGTAPTRRRRALRRLARLLVVVRQGEQGTIGFRADSLGAWAAPVTLVVGRRLKELTPGSMLVTAPPRGAASLDLAVRRMPRLARELVDLQRAVPTLRGVVRDVLAPMLGRDARRVERDLARGDVPARVDAALAFHLRGLALLEERRPREAVAEFESALRSADDFAPAAYALAIARRRMGDAAGGATLLRTHRKTHPEDPDSALFLARFLGEAGDHYGSRRAYRDAIRRFPEAMHLRIQFAADLQSWGDGRGAAEQFDAARTAQPADARLAFMTGRARVSAGRPADAVEPLEQAVGSLTGGERAEAMYWLLAAFREQGRHERAMALADELVGGLGRGQEELLDELAEYFEERHDYDRARRATTRARKLRGGGW